MNYNEKVLLVSKSEKEIGTIRAEFLRCMKIGCGIKKCLDYYLLYVYNKSDYRLGLIYANHLANPHHIKNTKYVDVQGNLVELDKFSICQVKVLRGNEEVLLQKLKKELSKGLGLNVSMKQIPDSNHCYEFSARFCQLFSDLSDGYGKYAMSFQECIYKHSFLGVNVYMNNLEHTINEFIQEYMLDEDEKEVFSIKCFDMFGEEILTNKQQEKKIQDNLKTYLEKSSLCIGVKYPEGPNIAPKYEEKEGDYLRSNGCAKSYFLKTFDFGKTKSISNGIAGILNCSTHLEEEYTRIQNEVGAPFFVMEDELTISYKVVMLDETKLKVASHVTVNRIVDKERLSNIPSIYEELYQNATYKNCTFEFDVKDYYEIIDLQLLLHCTDSSKCYETYKIPIGFKFEDGLNVALEEPKVYYDMESCVACCDFVYEVKKSLLKEV